MKRERIQISKFLAGEVDIKDMKQQDERFFSLLYLIRDNIYLQYNTRTLGKLTGFTSHISAILRRLEKDGYITFLEPPRKFPANNPPRIPIATEKLLPLVPPNPDPLELF